MFDSDYDKWKKKDIDQLRTYNEPKPPKTKQIDLSTNQSINRAITSGHTSFTKAHKNINFTEHFPQVTAK